jgi:SAM-dependent methyltransferase
VSSGEDCRWCAANTWGQGHDRIHDRLKFAPGTWCYRRCQSCGSLQLAPLPSSEQLRDFYPAAYHPAASGEAHSRARTWWSGWEQFVFFSRLHRRQVASLLQETRLPRGGQVLDIGCGTGERIREFQRRGYVATGLDFDAEAVRLARSRLNLPVHCADLADLAQLEFSPNVALVTAFYVLEHVVDVRAVMADILGLLSPGGWFVAAVPLADSWQARYFGRRWSQISEAPRHVTIPSRVAVRRLLEEVGFGDIRLRADTLWNSAAAAGLSLVPGAASGARTRVAARLAGACAAAAWVPVAWCENGVLPRPALGIAYGRKP